VLCGLGVCPPIVLDQRLELDLQAIVSKVFFGQIAALPVRAAAKDRDIRTDNGFSARPRHRHCVQALVS